MNNISKIFLVIIFAFLSITLIAQPLPPGGGAGGIGPPSQTGGNQVGGGAPLDGGLSILLIFGSAFAVRKTYKRLKLQKD